MEKERKLQIIRMAVKRFIKHGLKKTTLDEIARDLRIGKATLYHYFTSKEDLYYQTLRFEIAQFMEEVTRIFNAENTDIRKKLLDYLILKENIESKYKLIYDLVLHIVTEAEFKHEKDLFLEMLESERIFFKDYITKCFKKSNSSADDLANFISIQGWSLIFKNRFSNDLLPESEDKNRNFLLNIITSYT